ncbi:MAG: amidohydrolase [Chloroflexi bacterium]|nr:amidohydrolase [Chloroflexota bacterium]
MACGADTLPDRNDRLCKGATATPSNAEQLKRRVIAEIDRNADEIMGISKTILGHPESGFKEFKTSALAEGVLNDLGIETRNGLGITGVKGRLEGSSVGPNVAVMGELDSNIVPQHPLADPITGAAHACGHHCQIGAMLGVAYGLANSGVMAELTGGVNFIAVPAEEYLELEWRTGLREAGEIEFLGGKPELIRLGQLDDSDICMLTHTTTEAPSFSIGKTNNGMVGKTIRYHGYSSHAGGSPHLGINALNAAEVALAAIHAQRDTFKDEDQVRIHPIITRGGSVVNAVPDDVRMETYVRGASLEAILDANSKVDRALRAGALGIGAEVEISTAPGYLPFRESPDLGALWKTNAVALVGEDEIAEGGHSGGSTDMGDVSYLMPTIQPYASGAIGRGHSEDYMVTDYEMAVIKPAKVMAMTVIDLLHDGARGAKNMLDNFRPEMTKETYLATMRELFTTRSYTE